MNLELEYPDETTGGIPKEIYEKALEAAKKIGKGRKAFRRMLETYVPQTSYSVPQNPKILNLGCGICYEAFVLSSYFGNQPDGFSSKDVLVVGIDIDEKEIERAKDHYKSPDFSEKITKWVEPPNYKFIHGDARRLRELVDDEFDVVVARHPNVAEIQDDWYKIFKESYEIMKPEGFLIATSFSDIEHGMLEELIKKVGYKIALSSSNLHAIPTDHKDVSIDRKVLLARKGS